MQSLLNFFNLVDLATYTDANARIPKNYIVGFAAELLREYYTRCYFNGRSKADIGLNQIYYRTGNPWSQS